MGMKYISEFVKRMRAIDAINNQKRVFWHSPKQGTHVKKKHGELLY